MKKILQLLSSILTLIFVCCGLHFIMQGIGLSSVEQEFCLEKVKVSKSDIEAEWKRIADSYQMDVEKVREMVPEESVAEDMKVKKAMDLVKENAIVK